jgi:hypothetical protein
MNNTIKESLLTIFYYFVTYFIIMKSISKYPSNGALSEAFLILLGFIVLSIVALIYTIVKMLKGESHKIVPFMIHIIALFLYIHVLRY